MAVAKYPERQRVNLTPVFIVLAIVLIAAAGGWYFYKFSTPVQPAALTPEAKAYVRNLGLEGVEMKATANYVGSTLVEITGRILNKGNRPLRLVELNCVFYDVNLNVIHRERVPIVKRSALGSLKPGENRGFRMPFDAIPEGWNQAMPQLVIANIEFEQ
ncbi:MAG: hypothetical protein HXY18_04195 [Bryobacteraceae bacterium]|nr:hypothetical protein [Bryobacteraceae bacterium]